MKENKTKHLFASSYAVFVCSFLLLGFATSAAAQASCQKHCQDEGNSCADKGAIKEECEALCIIYSQQGQAHINAECMTSCKQNELSRFKNQYTQCMENCIQKRKK